MDKSNLQDTQNTNYGTPKTKTYNDESTKKNNTTPNMEGVLLDTPNKNSNVRDPLFAARVLGEQGKISRKNGDGETPNIKNTTIHKEKDSIKKKFGDRAIRTYHGDVTEIMRGQKTSLAQIVIAEQKSKDEHSYNTSPKSDKNKTLKILSLILIVLGLLVLFGGVFYFTQNRKSSQNKQEPKIKSIIFAESYKEIDLTNLTKQKIINTLSLEIKTLDIRLDYIEYIYPVEIIKNIKNEEGVKVSANTQIFFSKIEAKIPDVLSRSLEKEFMFGIHSFNGNQPFIILKTNFTENAFAGMLEWEKNMARGILPLFAIEADSEIYESKFEDSIIKNRDIRALYDSDRKIVLLYTFLGENTIIITTDKDTLDEVINRIQRP